MSAQDEGVVGLLRELQRTQGTGFTPRYPSDSIDKTISEIDALYTKVQESIRENAERIRSDPSFSCAITVHYTTIMRQKRVLLAYLMERLKRIQHVRWEIGAVLPEDIKGNMSEHETEFYQTYDRLLGTYMEEVGLDITTDPTPPTTLLVEVRVLEDYGEIFTANGMVNLEKNTTHFLPRSDVEGLIRRGILEHIV